MNSASPAEQRLQVVQIVCLGIAWKKYVFTDSVARMRAMKVPCVVQSYSVLQECNADADLTELEVYADGHPEVIDCMSLASWKHFHQVLLSGAELRSSSRAASD